MIRTLKSTILLILVIIFLPTIIFSIYEIGSLRNNEKVIETIYKNQLDAILYSVNQYSEDAISSWANKLEYILHEEDKYKKEALNQFINETPSVNQILQFDTNKNLLVLVPEHNETQVNKESLQSILSSNDTIFRRLQTYLRGGYRKIESFALNHSNNQIIVFAIELHNDILFNAIVFDPVRFIGEVLDPKIQEIAQNEFSISVFKIKSDSIIYSSDKQFAGAEITHAKAFWLIPDFSLGIELKNQTISDLAKSRSMKDLILICIVDLGLLLGVWLIYRNVRKQLELSQLKSDFVSNVSHEIRTPLALISMYIETLELGRVKTKEKIKEYYDIILQETQRLSGIVNKILNFSQIESGKKTYRFSLVDINPIVCDVASTFKFNLESEGFEYTVDCKAKLPDVYVDGESVTDALVNLIKYSLDEKQINISTGSDKSWVFVEVADKGIGISENEQKYIFDKFYRVTEKNLALKAKGSGLGLTIVKHIIDSHRGKIEVKSKKGEGTVFRLLFPIN
ncbi:Adaptive-response sensory-kinase SasA [subsurface metagenome]